MLTDEKLKLYIQQTKKKLKVKIYTPLKYFRGLRTKRDVQSRIVTMISRKNSNDTSLFPTDAKIKTKPSGWSLKFKKKYPGVSGKLPDIAKATGIPLKILKAVFARGIKAYLTGHRPGASKYQWAYGRVYAYIMNPKRVHDLDLY